MRKRLGRLATVFTASSMALLLLGVGSVSAANPSWAVSFSKLPTTVAAGNNAGWFVTVTNNGPSNINDLSITLTSEVPGQLPSYLSDLYLSSGGSETCSTSSGAMVCNVGTLGDDQYVTFTVAFLVPSGTTGSFDLNVGLRAGTGDTGSDRGGNSRGDQKTFTSSTGISQSINFDGGFTLASDTFQTTGNLGRGNKQTTTLNTTDAYIPVTVTDGISSYPCNLCSNLVGEWSVLDVNNGTSGPIKVTLMIWGGSVPGGVAAEDLYLLHADGTGAYNVVDQVCDATHSNADCLEGLPTKIGNNYKIVAWLTRNGGLRGIY